jgi:hypothetical protein
MSRLVKMSTLVKSLQDAKVSVADHAKSMPEGAAEHEDYATWGREFAKRLVSVLRNDLMDFGSTELRQTAYETIA